MEEEEKASLYFLLAAQPGVATIAAWAEGRAPAGTGELQAGGLPSSPGVPLLAAVLARRLQVPVVVVGTEAEPWYEDARALIQPAPLPLVHFSAIDTLAFDRLAPGEHATRRRLDTLEQLRRGGAQVVFTSWNALLRPTLSPEEFRAHVLSLSVGHSYHLADLVQRLVAMGFQREGAVEAPGQVSLRGGILDCFPPTARRPWRGEWFGDYLESLREFDIETQVSVGTLEQVTVLPARELIVTSQKVARAVPRLDRLDAERCLPEVRAAWLRDLERLKLGTYFEGVEAFAGFLSDRQASLLDHLPPEAPLLVWEPARALQQMRVQVDELGSLMEQEVERGELPGGLDSGLLDLDALWRAVQARRCLTLERTVSGPPAVDLAWEGLGAVGGRLDAFAEQVRATTGRGGRVAILSPQQRRIQELLEERAIYAASMRFDWTSTTLPPGALVLGGARLGSGLRVKALDLELWSDREIFGTARMAPVEPAPRVRARPWKLDFKPGDLVVHVDYGIARFVGMAFLDEDSARREYMHLEYAEGDRLYVPVEYFDRVQRYAGGTDAPPRLQRLGSGEWDRVKRRVRASVEEVARELLELYSRRQVVDGHAFAADGPWQEQLEQAFPFELTADQQRALVEIKQDMELGRPMDRLLCGDVGFGKTELAVRAAFKAALDGKQVAVLVPTTVLAQQHLLTFQQRLQPFPVTIEMLSRFRSDAEIQDTLQRLTLGTVDIVIGTHRLLQKDVAFRDLGLVILDEEQRFGVVQKERLKRLRTSVDVLSLSATPIPRTLHMALGGVRDLSVIQTPPEERLPIKTFVTGDDDDLIREVLVRELNRGGQAYFVHNRVRTIQRAAERVRQLVPHARVAVGHGQMPEQQLAQVMVDFVQRRYDILVCTTIIESGLDIPNVNTIVVTDSHGMGLAQLYQLRGRVGRSGQRAYAYFLYNPYRSTTEEADKRLDVIADLQDLGSGFKLALHDLEIRGAGNLLGVQQHGLLAAVGLELYNEMLRDAVAALQGQRPVELPTGMTMTLPVPYYLPRSYVPDERVRLQVYQELAALDEVALEQAPRQLQDRFGPLPEPVRNLLFALRVKHAARRGGLVAIDLDGKWLDLKFSADQDIDLARLQAQFRSVLGLRPGKARLDLESAGKRWKDLLVDILAEMARLDRAAARAS